MGIQRSFYLVVAFICLLGITGCKPVIDFSVDMKSLKPGDTAQLSWEVSDGPYGATVQSVRLEPGFGEQTYQGAIDVAPGESTTYSLVVTADKPGGGTQRYTADVTVHVGYAVSEVDFADEALATCVDEQGVSYTWELTELKCTDRGISDLRGLEFFSYLEILWVDENPISNFDALAALQHVEELALANTGIEDLSPVAEMGSLDRLDIGYNGIEDISPLNDSPLTQLYMYGNAVEDLAAQVPGLVDLIYLTVGDNGIETASFPQFTALEELELGPNPIDDLTPLYELRNRVVMINLRGMEEVTCEQAQALANESLALVYAPTCSSQEMFWPPELTEACDTLLNLSYSMCHNLVDHFETLVREEGGSGSEGTSSNLGNYPTLSLPGNS